MVRRKGRGGGGEPPPRKGPAPPGRDSDEAVTEGRGIGPAPLRGSLELRRQAQEQEAAESVIDLRVGVAVAGAGTAVGRAVQRGVLVQHVVDPGAEAVV